MNPVIGQLGPTVPVHEHLMTLSLHEFVMPDNWLDMNTGDIVVLRAAGTTRTAPKLLSCPNIHMWTSL